MHTDQMKEVTSKIEQGRWVKNLPHLPGVAVKVRGLDNSDHRRWKAEASVESTREQLEDPKYQEYLQAEGLRLHVLQGWTGIDNIEFSPAAAEKLLHDPEVRVFKDAVFWAAANVTEIGRESLETEAKN